MYKSSLEIKILLFCCVVGVKYAKHLSHLFIVLVIWSLSDVVATINPRVQKQKKNYTSPEYYKLIFSEELVHILN